MDQTAKALVQLAKDKVTHGQHHCCGRVATGKHSDECPSTYIRHLMTWPNPFAFGEDDNNIGYSGRHAR